MVSEDEMEKGKPHSPNVSNAMDTEWKPWIKKRWFGRPLRRWS